MRKILVFLLIFASYLLPVAGDSINKTVLLTAYKYGHSSTGVEELFEMSFLNPENASIATGSSIPISVTAREDNSVPAFSWMVIGNRFQSVQFTLSFSPLYKISDSNPSSYVVIPYDLDLHIGTTRVGNFTIPYKSETPLAHDGFILSLPKDGGGTNDYKFSYSDHGTIAGNEIHSVVSFLVNEVNPVSDSKSVIINYDMSVYSKVKLKNNNGDYGDPDSIPTLCNHWNRTGDATIKLKISEAGNTLLDGTTAVEDGRYTCTVRLEYTEQ